MKNLIRSICRESLSRRAFAPKYWLMAAGGLCAAAVVVFAWMNPPLKRKASGQAGAVFARFEETLKTLPEERPHHHLQTADYAQALDKAFALEKRGERKGLVCDLLSGWVQRDVEGAVSWIAALEDPATRRFTRSAVCLAVAEQNPRQAIVLALAPALDEEEDRGLLEYLTMQWCERETETAVDWACQQPSGEWRDRLLARVSFVLSKSNPAAAAHLVSTLGPGNLQDEAAMAVLHQWAVKDSDAALQWAKAFTQPILRERAFAEISNLRGRMVAHEVK